MSDLISRSELIKAFNNKNVQITFDLPVEEVLGEDVDLDDFAMLVQDAIQVYKKMVIDTIKNQPTAYSVEKVVEELEEAKGNVPVNRLLDDIIKEKPKELGQLIAYDKAIEIVKQEAEQFGTDTNVGSKGNDVLEFANLLKELCCKKDEDYDNPVISPKYLNDTIENLLLDFNGQYNNGWISCSERLPEEAFGCLVTVMDCEPSTQTDFEKILPYFVGYDGETWNDADGKEIPFEVIAWMPLPEPYKESDRYDN